MSTKTNSICNKVKRYLVNKKQDMVEKDSFRQAGEDLLRKVREEERADLRLALSSWQKLEERLNAPRKTSVLRIRYLVSSVAAAVMLLLAVGCYFGWWGMISLHCLWPC